MNARIWDAEVFLIGLCSLPDIRKSAVSQNQLRRRRSTIKKMEFMYVVNVISSLVINPT